ncbi:NADPH dehydrogenase NamA [Flavihumibacter sp. R14]|nr:NADPH dehydrogenase NamA [Flavihumibacter soli]
MSALFSPLIIKSLHLKNRIVVSPMCQYSSEEGFANDWHMVHLGSRAIGGAALIIAEATAVSPEGRISASDLGLWTDEHIPGLKRITEFIHQNGSVAGIQLAHAGRKASTLPPWSGGKFVKKSDGGWQTLAPSAIPFREDDEAPIALTDTQIRQMAIDFAAATERALEAGFKVLEIHAAHGYLIHQFLSPLSNKREDHYGGSFENRIRFLMEVLEAVQNVWPQDLPLFVRISATDWAEGGWDIKQSIELCRLLKHTGVDLIDCSSGGLVSYAKISTGPGYQVEFSERIKHDAGILTGAVGLITNAMHAESILQSQKADVIILARQLLRDPYFPLHAASQLGDDIQWPVQYERAKKAN